MKKILFTILSFFPAMSLAQTLEFELIRTPEVPGFFAVQIFPNTDMAPMEIQNIFVENFKEEAREKWEDLESVITEFGGLIVNRAGLEKYKHRADVRVVFLGGEIQKEEGVLHFPGAGDDMVADFQNFSEEYLQPVFLQNVTVDFGGNVSEVYPKSIKFLGETPRFFIGKFEKEMKTRMELRATSAMGEIVAITPLEINEYVEHPDDRTLSKVWEEYYQAAHAKDEKVWDLKWLGIFPWILFVVGVLILIWIFMTEFMPRRREARECDENLWGDETPIKQVEKCNANLPFEVTKK